MDRRGNLVRGEIPTWLRNHLFELQPFAAWPESDLAVEGRDGTAPIDVSSGDQKTHRLSRQGNRQLNAAIHVAAVTQARDPGPGRDHYRRKIAGHKTVKEARRSLKRRISNAIYRRILADQQRLELQAA